MKDQIIVIVGPTAVGKTSLSIKLAQKFDGEIISGDSMQVYKKLDIGTAKVSDQEAQGVPHHLIDIKGLNESYSASDFKHQARQCIHDITSRGKLPIVVGGTGLYIESLLYDVSHGGKADPDYDFRKQMEDLAQERGRDYVWERLKDIDPDAAEKIHPNNLVRIIRALEVYHVTGEKFSSFQKERQDKNEVYDAYIIGLNTDRTLLYDRINQRVDLMMDQGLLDEVKYLFDHSSPDAESRRGIGYRELIDYLDGSKDLDQALADIKQNSRHYAKRQLTWFRNRTPVTAWYDLVQEPDQVTYIYQDISKFLERWFHDSINWCI